MNRPLLTNSRLAVARSCQRKHFIEYGLGFRPARDAEQLVFGRLMHLALEAWWMGSDDRLNDALQVLELAECDPYDRARARVLMIGYDARWADDAALYEVLGVEVQFRAPLINPSTGRTSQTWDMGGKLDALVREIATGRNGVVEHKTSSDDITPGSPYWARLRMDPQISIYYAGGAAILGKPIDFCLYDVVRKFSTRPAKATPFDSRKYTKDGLLYKGQRDQDETPEEYETRLTALLAEAPATYFARGEVVRLDGEVDEAVADVWMMGQLLREADRLGRHPRNPNACLQWGYPCAYLPVCSGEGSLEDQTLYRKATSSHEELSPTP